MSSRPRASTVGRFDPRDLRVLNNALIHELFHVANPPGRERLVIEVKGQLIRSDIRPFLRGMLAHRFVQCPVEQMSDSVVALDRTPSRPIHSQTNRFAHFRSAARVQHAPVDDQFTLLLRVRYLQTSHFRPVRPGDVDETCVANLSPHLGVTCGAIHNQVEFL